MVDVTKDVIGWVIAGALIPVGISSFISANTTGWSASTIAMWGIIPIVLIAIYVMKTQKGK